MTTFTDKELIKEIKERIGSLDVRDNVERRAYEIALASLEAEPVAWLHSDNGLGIPAITRSKNIADSWLSKGWYVQPLYIAKPVPVVPDVRPSLNNGIVGFDEGWNACRAVMLHGAEPVSQTYKLNVSVNGAPY
ncbi:valyl-tRNA synthetase [Escherichia coli]|uniref:valyl-tRNA synthetase n=1 Tax=Escherichia coli TaxID=562 RepID=UPI001013C53B